jgi:chaperonin GroEL|tara:strand:+ start:1083 stop:2711 length:1629 start_codon:yes stop_codon:yes gene_type:complete
MNPQGGGYSPKDLKFGESGRTSLINGISKIANAVKSTLGPRGHTVLIESPNHTQGITVTKDGVTVAKAVDLLHPVENLAVRMMKEAADKTATSAGDGTTTAIVLTEAIVKAGSDMMKDNHNRTEILKHINKEVPSIITKLKSLSKPITKRRLKDVAIISANGDKTIGTTIAKTYDKVGKTGIVTVERSQTSSTYNEITNGIKVERGYNSSLFINDQKKDECILDDTYILVSDASVDNILNIESILKPIIQDRKKLLLICPCSENVVNTLAANVVKNGLKICNINPPQFGYKQHELMQDIAISVGATYFSEKTGDDLSLITFNDLGHASKVIVSRDSTVIIKDDAENGNVIEERVTQLWEQHKLAVNKGDKDFILSRIASLTGGIGVIYVGGQTDIEQKELYDRVDDAVCAVRSALLEGILPGGGTALHNVAKDYDALQDEETNLSKKIAYAILGKALKAPIHQILLNAGLDYKEIYKDIDNPIHGYDVKNEVYGDLLEMGVIDPMKVTKHALQNAVSVATTILSTNAIITMARTYESNEADK